MASSHEPHLQSNQMPSLEGQYIINCPVVSCVLSMNKEFLLNGYASYVQSAHIFMCHMK
jgi:hypothetical protein